MGLPAPAPRNPAIRHGRALARAVIFLHVVRSVLAIAAVAVTAGTAGAAPRVIYLNRDTTTVEPGALSDSASFPPVSNLIDHPISTPGWSVPDAAWSATLACVQRTWARFDVAITDVDPGPETPHVEVLVGGAPSDAGVATTFTGIAPMRDDCGVVDAPVVFVFPAALGDDPTLTCGIIAQEVAHTFGVDHELLAGDPMSYLPYTGERAFRDELASCGETEARQCGPTRACGEKQSSVQLLAQRVGLANGDTLGTVAITAPADKAVVPAAFRVAATATPAAHSQVTGAHLYIDGEIVDSAVGPGPFAFDTPNLPNGAHEIDIVADAGNDHFETAEMVEVEQSANDADALGCSAGGGSSTGGMTALVLACAAVLRAKQGRVHRCSSRASNAVTCAPSRTR